MRQKLLWAICIAVLGLVVAYGQRQPSSPAPGDVGRYQLYAGPSASHMAEDHLYRIDTRTGNTWEYMYCPSCTNASGAAGTSGWNEVKEGTAPQQGNPPK
jgi:hypothetical protein